MVKDELMGPENRADGTRDRTGEPRSAQAGDHVADAANREDPHLGAALDERPAQAMQGYLLR